MGHEWSVLGVWLPVAVLVLATWAFSPGFRRWLLPAQRHRAVPWSGFEVLFALLLVIGWPLLVYQLLVRLGLFTWVYGLQTAPIRQILWVQDLACPLTAVSIIVLVRVLSDTRPYQLGLTTHRAGRNVLAGFLAWLALTPFVYLVLDLATLCSRELLNVGPEEHPLTRLSRSGLWRLEWFLLVVSAVVAAPVVEELLFRGVVQPWLARRPWGGAAAMAAALVMGLVFWNPDIAPGDTDAVRAFRRLIPALFVLILLPPFLLVWRASRSPVAPAICGTSLFWAMMHTAIWPTPVPLFVLGLGLGYLAYRTQSLVAPLTLHALFNSVACVMLLYPQPAPPPVPAPEKGNETTSAGRFPAAVSTTTAVLGSWLPRRTYASAIVPSRGDTTDDVTCPTSPSSRSTRAPCGTAPSP
jgi:membrane protease YdiL (CAAX protease family)